MAGSESGARARDAHDGVVVDPIATERLSLTDAGHVRYALNKKPPAKERENVLRAIREGIEARLVKDDLERITARLEELGTDTAGDDCSAGAAPLLHPAMAQRYRREVENLRNALDRKDGRSQAAEHL